MGKRRFLSFFEILAISPSSSGRERGSLLTKRSQSNFEQTHQTKLNLFHSPHLNLPQLILKYISNDFSILPWLTFNILKKLFLCSNLEVKQIFVCLLFTAVPLLRKKVYSFSSTERKNFILNNFLRYPVDFSLLDWNEYKIRITDKLVLTVLLLSKLGHQMIQE